MSRIQHRTCASTITNGRLVFGNFQNQGNANVDSTTNLGPLTITASFEYAPGTFYQVLFKGYTSVTLAPGAIVISDPVGVVIPGNTLFYTRNFAQTTSGNQIPTNIVLRGSGVGEGQITSASGGSDLTLSGSVTASSAATYGPIAILGDRQDRNLSSVGALIGSWAQGFGGPLTTENRGWIDDAHSGISGVANLGVAGCLVSDWIVGTTPIYRNPLLTLIRPTHCWAGAGGNDLNAGQSVATITANLVILWQQIRAMGMIPCCFTIPPHTSSTDNWTTTGNQTVIFTNWANAAAYTAARVAINNFIMSLPSPLAYAIDVCQYIENDPVNHDGLWKTDGVTAFKYTGDGQHGNAYSYPLIAAGVNLPSFNYYV
jgi:hypothetical protein